MRDIIFRGRQKGGTEWFYGDLSYLVHDKQKCYIFPPDGYNSPDWYEVDPDTVGQYTGLTDKNGKKIFEGDIVHCISTFDEADMVVIFEAGEFHLVVCERYKTYETCMGYRAISLFDKEVIGNIYDNPELLEATP